METDRFKDMKEEPHRPLKQLKSLIGKNVFKLSKTEYRFVKLMNTIKTPLNDNHIIDFYKKNVMNSSGGRFVFKEGEWILNQYTDAELKSRSLAWFDRNLGAMIRKNILSDKGNNELNKLIKGYETNNERKIEK